jgi:anthranilate synthase component 2
MILLIDNYDSFSYNLYQMVGAIAPEIRVLRNDATTLDEIAEMAPTHIIISPGPGRPEHAGISEAIISRFAGGAPILGVCLGHQAICHVYGGRIGYAVRLIHGKASDISLSADCLLFRGLPPVVQGARYHSLALDRSTLPAALLVTAESDDGEVMGVRHRTLPVFGVQFHPESVLTPQGEVILRNFINIKSEACAGAGASSDADADMEIEKKNAEFRQESEND